MVEYSPTQIKAIVLAPMVSGSLSFIGSSGLLVMILWFSRIKLYAVVRRILFGMCVYDIFQSLASLASSFPVPPDRGVFGASGTVGTCDAQGFLTQMGVTGSMLYDCSLSVYFVSVIKFGVKDKAFQRKIEFWCHFIPNAFALSSSIFLQVGGYFNSLTGYACYISAEPIECLDDIDIECTHGGKDAFFYRKWLGVMIFFLALGLNLINMLLIIHSVLVQVQKSDRWRLQFGTDGTRCGSRLSTCCGKFFKTVKYSFHSNKDGITSPKSKDSCLLRSGDYCYSAANAPLTGHSDPLPSLDACLEPVEIRASVCYHKTSGIGDDEENELSLGVSKPRAPPSRSGTSTSPYEFNASKVRATVKRESVIITESLQLTVHEGEGIKDGKPRAPLSRFGTSTNTSEFNASKVLAAIKRESVIITESLQLTDHEEEVIKDDKHRAPPSRSGTRANPYEFNASKVRASIKKESSSTLGVGEPKGDTQPFIRNNISSRRNSNESESNDAAAGREEDNERDANINPRNDRVGKEVIAQALIYIGCFFLTYIFTAIVNFAKMQGKPVPFALQLLARLTMPMQGVFNIIVYTRPHIVSLRRHNPQYSWFKAFIIVFKTGGDNDSVGRRSNQQPASNEDISRRQELIRRDFNRRMTEVHSRSAVSPELIAAARQARLADEENWVSERKINQPNNNGGALDEELSVGARGLETDST